MLAVLLQQTNPFIRDFGPNYHEFVAEAFVKEPWNTYSSLFFLVPVFFWAIKLWGSYRENWMIVIILPFLFLNGIGSTFYHAFRTSNFFLILDFAPAIVVCLITGTYLWTKVIKKWYWGLLILISAYMIAPLMMRFFTGLFGEAWSNIGYFTIGTAFLLPALIFLLKTNYYKWGYVLMSILLLTAAIIFRSLDHPTPNPFPELLPQGTHFLWHIFSAMAVFSLGYYFYFIKHIELNKNAKEFHKA